jgi:hypothetical protein
MPRADSQFGRWCAFLGCRALGLDFLPCAVRLTLRDKDLRGHTAKAALPFEAPRMAGSKAHVSP